MRVRIAELADIDAILQLDHSYQTDHVWQMSAHQSGGRSGGGREAASEYTAVFRLARLPRQLAVPYPHDARTLRRILNRCDFIWVMQGDDPHALAGYIGIVTLPWQNTAWIPCMAVAPQARRTGVATQLLKAAVAQAKADGLHSVTVDVQTKNHPATRFCQMRGFRFAGYADNYYSTRDIALFFAHRIR